jgi:DNA-binding transcriptional LysR family regulator
MGLENIRLSQLRALLTVAETSSFSQAGLQLGVSQSAISHAIATLEAELGMGLLFRTRTGAVLTPEGKHLLPLAKTVLDNLGALGDQVNRLKGLEGGELRIAAFRSAATHLLPGFIAQFSQQFPGITVSIVECGSCQSIDQTLRQRQADIGIMVRPIAANDLETLDILNDEYLVLLSEQVSAPAPLTWADLAAYPLILPRVGDDCRILIDDYLDRFHQSLVPTYEISEDSTVTNMVSQGLGITIMAKLAAQPLPPGVQPRSLPVKFHRTIVAGILAEVDHSPAVFAFLEVVRAHRPSPHLPGALVPGE